ncbi:GAF domain-containing protein [Marinigracilibium pacificum]|uniref:GAF domain-containing protein n=1 Tax=Marinigracilibium pacificum TaxID=2729599 RepID=A0A848IUV9_9BACT|nr:GAF domain-containing protein [Marinigracilibium pacificum]NMM47011.1 GAF domain-containing protein [Marinigracilibium pacificum]
MIKFNSIRSRLILSFLVSFVFSLLIYIFLIGGDFTARKNIENGIVITEKISTKLSLVKYNVNEAISLSLFNKKINSQILRDENELLKEAKQQLVDIDSLWKNLPEEGQILNKSLLIIKNNFYQLSADIAFFEKAIENETSLSSEIRSITFEADSVTGMIDPTQVNEVLSELSEKVNASPKWATFYLNNIAEKQNNFSAEIEEVVAVLTKISFDKKEDILGTLSLRFNLGITFIVIFAILVAVMTYLVQGNISELINRVNQRVSELSKGNLPETRKSNLKETAEIHESINTLTENLRAVKLFALEVGQGQFDNSITVFEKGSELGDSLAEMRDSLKTVSDDAEIRNWANKGYAEFGDMLRKHSDDLKSLGQELITNLVKYLKVNQGGLFIVNGDESQGDDVTISLVGAYAFDRQKFLKQELIPGEGLVGQCYLEQKSIYLEELPEDYATIKSGLGGASPSSLYIVPLKVNGKVFGIIELASFNIFKEHEKQFIENLSENIASAISSVKINQNTKRLLEESLELTEQMRSQEEEMRQNMEELQATQEEMMRGAKAIQEKEERYKNTFDSIEEGVILLDKDYSIIMANKSSKNEFSFTIRENDNFLNCLPANLDKAQWKEYFDKAFSGEKQTFDNSIIDGNPETNHEIKIYPIENNGRIDSIAIYSRIYKAIHVNGNGNGKDISPEDLAKLKNIYKGLSGDSN